MKQQSYEIYHPKHVCMNEVFKRLTQITKKCVTFKETFLQLLGLELVP